MNIYRHRAYSRVGLIGNPSDGYNGKTISFTMRNFHAHVVLYPWDQLEILWSRQDRNRFSSVDELVQDVNLNGYYGGVRLVKATIKTFAEFCSTRQESQFRLDARPFSIRYETNIPRGVGLAGSSAIVVATLKCLIDYYNTPIPLPLQASLARAVENDELGIACGFQDRVVQVYEGLVYMDFSEMKPIDNFTCGHYESLDPGGLPHLFVAYDLGASKTSSSVHGPLRTRVQNNTKLAGTMAKIAGLTPLALQAIESKDAARLHELIDQNFDYRQQLYDIDSSHREMIQTARRMGASAKFAGSGGAIVGTLPEPEMLTTLEQRLAEADPNWRVFRPEIQVSKPVAQASHEIKSG